MADDNGALDKIVGVVEKPLVKVIVVGVAALVTVVNGGIAYYGWDSAKEIGEKNEKAKEKLAAITSVLERGYILFARAVEREFVEEVIGLDGVEALGDATDKTRAHVLEDLASLDVLEKEIKEESRRPTRFLMEGYLKIQEKNYSDAVITLNKYKEDVPIKLLLLGTAFRRSNREQEAIEVNNKLTNMLATRPSDRLKAKAYMNIGNILLKKRLYEEAELNYRRALRADQNLSLVHYNLAALYSYKAEYGKAIKSLCKYAAARENHVVVIQEIQSDPDKAFEGLMKFLGPTWQEVLRTRFGACS